MITLTRKELRSHRTNKVVGSAKIVHDDIPETCGMPYRVVVTWYDRPSGQTLYANSFAGAEALLNYVDYPYDI